MKLFDRYLIGEAMQVLIVGSLCVIGIFFGTIEFQRVMDLLNQFGLPPNTVLSIMMLQLPTGIAYCLPAGVLIATLVTLARQHNDSEFLALQVSGVPTRRLVVPYLMMGLAASFLAYGMNEYVAPQNKLLSQKLVLLGIYAAERPFVGQPIVQVKDANDRMSQTMVFGCPNGRQVKGLLFLDKASDKEMNIIWAERATWLEGQWVLENGNLFDFVKGDGLITRGNFRRMKFGSNAKLASYIAQGPTSSLEKTTSQLRAEIDGFEKSGKKAPAELRTQYYRRYSHPASCFFLVLAALPLMTVRRRRSLNVSFVYGGVLVVMFFLLQQICLSLSENSRLDPLVAAWLPLSVLCLIGLGFTILRRNS
ncbi:LptF/LptG family permease [Candidatus Obscuribacterales bacterium]|nr:LptF/LptG family permease [Candidatus Obscuribacterales bacterium]MBX3152686.1 LptF/LptG family permease [Candidatus Obscuribacterales bacterium]